MDDYRITQRAKVARTFQNIRLFRRHDGSGKPDGSPAQHLMRASGFTVTGIFDSPTYARANREAIEKSQSTGWRRAGLVERADDPAGELSLWRPAPP